MTAPRTRLGERGATLAELLVVLAVMAVALSVAFLDVRRMEAPLQTGVGLFQSFVRQARARAMATTSAVQISPGDASRLRAGSAANCAATSWTPEPSIRAEMPDRVTLDPTSWSVCFDSRGIADSNVVVTLSHADFGSRRVEILLGGGTRVDP